MRVLMPLKSQILAILLLSGCSEQPLTIDVVSSGAQSPPVQFVAFGDSGSGSPAQLAVGRAMVEVCAARGCDFAVMLGDNFYPSGVSSADDPQFFSKFEQPYQALKIPFFVALGNHDNGGAGDQNQLGDHEVEYAHKADRPSQKWHMPARYYRFTAPLGSDAPLAEFFALDSTPVAPFREDSREAWKPQTYGAAEFAWLHDALADSRARWKIVFAHHPYISNGGHGSAGRYLSLTRTAASDFADGALWKHLLEENVCAAGVDLMLQGHDHDLEWLKPTPACGKTQFITSGAGGAELTPFFGFREPTFWQREGRYGFFWISIRESQMTVAAYVLDAELRLPHDDNRQPAYAFEQTMRQLQSK